MFGIDSKLKDSVRIEAVAELEQYRLTSHLNLIDLSKRLNAAAEMTKLWFAVCVCLLLSLAGCAGRGTVNAGQTDAPQPSRPEEAQFSLPGYSEEDIIRYFCRVALEPAQEGEVDGNTNTLVRKWTSPIYYEILGHATKEDERLWRNLRLSWKRSRASPPSSESQRAGQLTETKFTPNETSRDLEAQIPDHVRLSEQME